MLERSGGLRLCACEHTRAHHELRPAWYGAPPDALDHGCYFCRCEGYKEAPQERQERSSLLSAEEYVARREALGLPKMWLAAEALK